MKAYQHKVSVVVPLFNPHQVYFKEAIESIIHQNIQNVEIILSDDTDDLPEYFMDLISEWNGEGASILYTKHQGEKGIFSNLNHALSKSTGEFVQFFCQDDIMNKELLEKNLHHLMENPNVGVVFSQFDVITDHGFIHALENRYNYRNELPDYINSQSMLDYFLKLGCLPGNLSPVMMRTSLLNEVGYFDAAFKFAGDFEYWVRAATQFDFYFDKEVLLHVRRHEDQASKMVSDIDLVKERSRIYSYLMDHQVRQNKKWRVRLYLNRIVGTQHIHKLVRGLIFQRASWKEIRDYIRLLNEQPFNFVTSLFLYVITLNNRLGRKIKLTW